MNHIGIVDRRAQVSQVAPNFMEDFSGYKWIKVKQFKFDKELSWEENYKELEKHHMEETTFLIETIRHLSQNGTEATALLS